MFKEFVHMSRMVGSRIDYTQAGGGNTSVKYGDGLMAVKASGYRLSDITETSGFAVMKTDTLEDVTEQQGFRPLRPSVEASLHAILKKYVIHSHPVYANLALCSCQGDKAVKAVMEPYCYIEVPYINPGAELCAALKRQLQPGTQAILLQNHGLLVTADTADEALRLHEEINNGFARYYSVGQKDFDAFATMLAKPLYPDQQVYLTLTPAQAEIMAAVMFIHFTLRGRGETPRGMDEAAQSFIEGWESEHYRKTIEI